MVVQGVWLVPMLRTVFSEQALKGVGKGSLDRGFYSQQVCSPDYLGCNGKYLEEGSVGTRMVEDPIGALPPSP